MNHHITINVVIENQSGHFLMVKEKDTGKWHFPSGLLKVNESLTNCAIREMKEAFNLAIQPEAILGLYQYHNSGPGMAVVFYTAVYENQLNVENDSFETVEWLSIGEIEQMNEQMLLNPKKHHHILTDLNQNRRLSIELLGDLIEETVVV